MFKFNLIINVIWLSFFLTFSCKKEEKKKGSLGGVSAATDSAFAYWISGERLYRGYCQSSDQPEYLNSQIDRNGCDITTSKLLTEFTASFAKNFQGYLNNSVLTANDQILLKAALESLREDGSSSTDSFNMVDQKRLNELYAKYLPVVETSMGTLTPIVAVNGNTAPINNGAVVTSTPLFSTTLKIPYGRLIYSPRFKVTTSLRASTLIAEATGSNCGATVTGVILFDRDGLPTWTINSGAGLFVASNQQSLQIDQIELSFTQTSFNWGQCSISVSLLNSTSDFTSDIASVSSQPISDAQIINDPKWRFRQTKRFTGGFSFSNLVNINTYQQSLSPVRAIKLTYPDCKDFSISNFRTLPGTICPSRVLPNAGRELLVAVGDCGAAGYGAKISTIDFSAKGSFWSFCDINVYTLE